MKRTVTLALLCCICAISRGQTVYGVALKNIDGGNINLNSYQGSKLLILLAPVSAYDSVRFRKIKAFQVVHPSSQVKLLGVMSIEDGYADSNKTAIKSTYQHFGIDILLTEGLRTKKAAGSSQSPLFNWLTTKSENKLSATDALGIGQKFIIDETGKLYSVSIPAVPLLSQLVEQDLLRKLMPSNPL